MTKLMIDLYNRLTLFYVIKIQKFVNIVRDDNMHTGVKISVNCFFWVFTPMEDRFLGP